MALLRMLRFLPNAWPNSFCCMKSKSKFPEVVDMLFTYIRERHDLDEDVAHGDSQGISNYSRTLMHTSDLHLLYWTLLCTPYLSFGRDTILSMSVESGNTTICSSGRWNCNLCTEGCRC
ncbi:uncharacterized protein LOC124706704 [Lolium rigidum]|uniref:uncharacterized protein LOC124706704 n=1 Tax=Lolium rigidum TaxID=89674 RepID=UPI001F5C565C|nr:uncharacterized protein LOC124706704 [Lolium rigidum]